MTAVATVARVVRGLVRTPARLALATLLGGLLVLASLAANLSGEADRVVEDIVPGPLLLVIVPLIALVHAVGALGDAHDDGTLVYLWLKPVPRWQLGVGATLGALAWVLPEVAVLTAAIAVAGGQADLLVPALAGTLLASTAWTAVFVGLGLRTTRSLLAGLAYILLWEGFLVATSERLAAVSVRRWSTAVFADLGNVRTTLPEASWLAAGTVLVVITLLGVAATTRWLAVRDVP